MEIKQVKNGWEFDGLVFTNKASALAAKESTENEDHRWAKLDLKFKPDTDAVLIYDGLKRATSFGTFVTDYLQQHGGSIVALAKEIDVSKQTIFDWMNAKSVPSAKHALAILQTMNCGKRELIDALKDNFARTPEIFLNKLNSEEAKFSP